MHCSAPPPQLPVIILPYIQCVESDIKSKSINQYIFILLYLYSAQYRPVLQDSKRYLTHPAVQVQPDSQDTDIALTERQSLKDDHL